MGFICDSLYFSIFLVLPNSELQVSQLCIGCWQFNNNKIDDITWPPQSEETSQSIVNRAIELGINFFDTAEAYNNHVSEEVLGRCLQSRRKDCIVASKYGAMLPNEAPYTAVDIETSLTKSLTALQTDYIDIYQIHWSHFIADVSETVKELKRQQSLGRIRYYSVANFGPKSLQEFVEAGGKPITNQVPYNLFWRAVEYDVIPACEKYDVDILTYSTLQQGLLTGKFKSSEDVPPGRRRTRHFKNGSTTRTTHGENGCEKQVFEAVSQLTDICKKSDITLTQGALSWLIAQPRVASLIVGASTPKQVEENCKLVDLPQDVLRSMSDATEDIKTRLGRNCDEWRSGKLSRYR